MQRFDRYLLAQLLVHFGFFALVLVGVYWVNRAVQLFDELIADGHSAGVFLEFTILSLPSVMILVMPLASFAAATYVTNQLSNESEMTVMQAAGMSPWRIARPVMIFGLGLCMTTMVLTHVLKPASRAELHQRERELTQSISARLLREGDFLHPVSGVTFYIREISTDGLLQDVLLSDRRQDGRAVTYTAQQAYLLRDPDGPKLVMQSGMAQTLSLSDQRLSTTDFRELTYDISDLVRTGSSPRPRLDETSTFELLTQTARIAEETNSRVGRVLEAAHYRFQQPLLVMVAALIGYSALMTGTFSRFGVSRQLGVAIALLVVVKFVESIVTEPARANAALWPLVYVPTCVGLLICALMLRRASDPFGSFVKRLGRAK